MMTVVVKTLLVAAAAALLAAGCGGTRTVTRTVTVNAAAKTGPGAPAVISQFGYVRSLRRKGAGYELRFDPAWLLSGVTAARAKQEDTGSSDVPNDYYLVNEGNRQLTYLVPPRARVTVLSHSPTGQRITVAQLVELVRGRNPLRHPLFEPISTGFWIVVRNDTIQSLDQQYFP
jgi:hypothetical protein